jgi:hypothetical protein
MCSSVIGRTIFKGWWSRLISALSMFAVAVSVPHLLQHVFFRLIMLELKPISLSLSLCVTEITTDVFFPEF